ncbi:MAG: hypothetical protein PHD62_03440, partial [Bacteroidales bacterium]|nr:hypothetical protein [Bacteroidales bacterium]
KHLNEIILLKYSDDYIYKQLNDIRSKAKINSYFKDCITMLDDFSPLIGLKETIPILMKIYESDNSKKKDLFKKKYNGVVFALLEDEDVSRNYIINNLIVGKSYNRAEINDVISNAFIGKLRFKEEDEAYKFFYQIVGCKVNSQGKEYESVKILDYNPCNINNEKRYSEIRLKKKSKKEHLFKETGSIKN